MKRKNEILIGVIGICFGFLCLFTWSKPAKETSFVERRELAQFPKVSIESLSTGAFMEEFENYALDQFPMRDWFRSLKAKTSLKKDNNGIYIADGYINSMEYPLNEKSLLYASKVFERIYDSYLKKEKCNVYLSIIPDKNYFFAKEGEVLSLNYEKLVSIMKEKNNDMSYIDIFDELSGEDYYKTDTHWKQDKLLPVVDKISKEMGIKKHKEYEMRSLEEPFYGVLYGQAALQLEPDKINYLTNAMIDGYRVYDKENEKEIPVYDLQKAKGKDLYEMFLGGSLSLVTIENDKCDNAKQLIIFRDSFGSSIAPLLAEGYSKTTLVDIRYLNSNFLHQFIEFENADVLFLYSTLVLNHSETLK